MSYIYPQPYTCPDGHKQTWPRSLGGVLDSYLLPPMLSSVARLYVLGRPRPAAPSPAGATVTLPTLYKRTQTGAIEEWRIAVTPHFYGDESGAAAIHTFYGHVDGAKQETFDVIREGKNIGRANATTPLQQAEKEARSKWEKKIAREGYVESLERAQEGATDQAGGIAPMLAKSWEDVQRKFKFPADAQRKLDGVRCVAIIKNGQVSLWSRKRAPITGVPHVIAALESMGLDNAILDGELFKLGLGFQRITSFVRSGTPKRGHEILEYHVYDAPGASTVSNAPWVARCQQMAEIPWNDVVVPVETIVVRSFEEAKTLHDRWVQEGYEGLMLRNQSASYQPGKRSADLVKVKSFQEGEFKIVGVSEGRGKFAGLAMFTCEMDGAKTFDCCAPGTLEERKQLLSRGATLIGQMLTVKYFEKTDDGLPRFPTGKAVRDYE